MRAQIEVLDSLLLIALVVVLITVTGGFIAGAAFSDATSKGAVTDVSVVTVGADLQVEHGGGDTAALSELSVVVRRDGTERVFDGADLSVSGDGDGTFDPGEVITLQHGFSEGIVSVFVVDSGSNAVIFNDDVAIPAGASAPSMLNATATDDGDGVVDDGDQVTISVDVSDPDGVSTVTADASDFGAGSDVSLTDGNGDGTYDATVTVDTNAAASDGAYAIAITATDGDGNQGTTETNELVLDTQPPTVTMLRPSDGATTTDDQQRITLSVSDDDAGVAASSIVVRVTDGEGRKFDDVGVDAAGISYENERLVINAGEAGVTWADGTVDVQVDVADEVGRTTSFNGSFTVASAATPPVIYEFSASNTGKKIDYAWIVSDVDDGLAWANLTVTDPAGTVVYEDDVQLSTTEHVYSGQTGNLDGGTEYTVTLVVKNAVGLTNSSSQNVTTSGGGAGGDPSLDMATASADDGDGIVEDGDQITITADVSNHTGVASVTADASAFGAGSTVSLTDPDDDGTYTGTVTVDAGAAASDGDHVITVTMDPDKGPPDSLDTNALTLDTTPPSLTTTTPTSGATVSDDQQPIEIDVTDGGAGVNPSTFDVTVTDADGTTFSNATTSDPGISYSSGSLTISASDAGMTYANGDVDVHVEVADRAGKNTTLYANFVVDTSATPPTINTFDVTDGNGNQLDVSWDVSDDIGLSWVNVTVKNNANEVVEEMTQEVSGTSHTDTWSTSNLSNKETYTVTITVKDTDELATSEQETRTV